MAKHYSLGIYDYDRTKICELYDSNVDLLGQAYDIKYTKDDEGYHALAQAIILQAIKDFKPAYRRLKTHPDDKPATARVKEITPGCSVVICQHEPVSGAHVGPGMLALFFRGKER